MKIKYVLPLLLTAQLLTAHQADLADYVNTLQGTFSTPELSYGNTYPTVATPYPVHSFSPQTGKNGDGWK